MLTMAQLPGNGSRLWLNRRDLRRRRIDWFALDAVPCAVGGELPLAPTPRSRRCSRDRLTGQVIPPRPSTNSSQLDETCAALRTADPGPVVALVALVASACSRHRVRGMLGTCCGTIRS